MSARAVERSVARASALALVAWFAAACGGRVDPGDYPRARDLRRELAVATMVRRAPRAVDGRASVTRAPAVDARCTAAAAQAHAQVIPAATTLRFYTALPARAALRLRLERCAGAGTLTVRADTDGPDGETRLTTGGRDLALRLPRAGGPARVELRADGAGAWLVSELGIGLRRSALDDATRAQPRARLPRRPNLLVYLIDALRRDGLGVYGNPRPVSPELDRLAREGVVFADAIAQAPWTRPAVASIFTGLEPHTHGVLTSRDALAPAAITLAELLHDAGYRTYAVVQNVNVSGKFGMRQGFDRMKPLMGPHESAPFANRLVLQWLDGGPRDRPFFAYVHTVEPHGPYEPAEALRARFAPGVPAGFATRPALRHIESEGTADWRQTAATLRALYDAEVAANDEAFGALRRQLERRGLWANTVVVVLADHGEEFYEHGTWEHDHDLHGETVRIPLLVRVPGLPGGRRIESLAQQVDLLPTLLDLAGQTPPPVDGTSLVPALLGATTTATAVRSWGRFDDRDEAAVTSPRFRLLVRWPHAGGERVALYDRARDPRETRDVRSRFPIAAAYLRSVLRWPRARPAQPLAQPAGALDERSLRQLRALGYVE